MLLGDNYWSQISKCERRQRILTQDDIQKAINARQFNTVHFKTKQSHIHILENQAVKDLKKLECDYQIIFQKHHYKYLFGKNMQVQALKRE